MTAPAIGIDLGTTYSCVGVYRNERVEIIVNAQGNRTTPSVVSFGKERLVGEPAKDQEANNPENTIYGVKRLIGCKWKEPNVQNNISLWPFKVINDNGLPKIAVTHDGQERSFFPEEISAMVLRCMKAAAEAHLGKAVRNAVVTVPAYFNDSQRQATRDAAAIAGLSVLRIINEPTAAALAYGLDQPLEEERNVLIFDFGGGTFDVSVLCIEEGIFEVRSTAGDTHLGGEDLDTRLTVHLAEKFRRRHKCDLTGNKKALRRLRTASERAKRMLSIDSEASIELDSLHEGIDFLATVTRARFEELCEDLFRRTLEPVKQALEDAKLRTQDICEVVLVGGSTRIPRVQALLREYFDGRELTHTVNPDEAVAAGAAVQAALLDGEPSRTVTDLVLRDVTPLSLGTRVCGGIMSVIIPRNTPIPVKKTRKYHTLQDNQTYITREIREGERKLSDENNLLGKYTIKGLPKAPAKTIYELTTFEVDADGILHVSSVISGTDIKQNISIKKGRLSKNQIEKLVKEAEKFEQEDQLRKEMAESRSRLEIYCRNLKIRTNKNKAHLSTATRRTLRTHSDETLSWLERNPQASKETLRRKKQDLELLCDLMNLRL